MNLILDFETMPLHREESGTIRVGDSRVTLDSVIGSFETGATPEETIQQFPTLELADVYFVFGFYLRHRQELEETYLGPRRAQIEAYRREAQERQLGLRERLLKSVKAAGRFPSQRSPGLGAANK